MTDARRVPRATGVYGGSCRRKAVGAFNKKATTYIGVSPLSRQNSSEFPQSILLEFSKVCIGNLLLAMLTKIFLRSCHDLVKEM